MQVLNLNLESLFNTNSRNLTMLAQSTMKLGNPNLSLTSVYFSSSVCASVLSYSKKYKTK